MEDRVLVLIDFDWMSKTLWVCVAIQLFLYRLMNLFTKPKVVGPSFTREPGPTARGSYTREDIRLFPELLWLAVWGKLIHPPACQKNQSDVKDNERE